MACMTPWMKTNAGRPSKAIANSMLAHAAATPGTERELSEQELRRVSGGAIDSYVYFLGYDGHYFGK